MADPSDGHPPPTATAITLCRLCHLRAKSLANAKRLRDRERQNNMLRRRLGRGMPNVAAPSTTPGGPVSLTLSSVGRT
jgi:hypothetical protein